MKLLTVQQEKFNKCGKLFSHRKEHVKENSGWQMVCAGAGGTM